MVKKEEFTFDSRDGATKIHAVRWVPEGKVVCILQIIHGMAEYVERYEQLAQYLGEKGILVTGDDHLGHGKSVGEEGAYGYFCEQDPATVVVRDVHRLKKITQEEYPGIPYVIFLGEEEISSGVVACMDMATGEQTKLEPAATVYRIKAGLDARSGGTVILG